MDKSKGESEDVAAGKPYVLESELPAPTRVLAPNSAMTMDFRINRLNLHVSKDYVVEKVSFG
ncbi:hypothetical protein DFJ74DRAFT_697318 [Hyaloraphidium curvatum]|nr:hypothetical protein DFJ74DRAFT_697318 [Hyaloraphidium curvatum]